MNIQTLDIGGSGVKCARFQSHSARAADMKMQGEPQFLGVPDWANFEDWLLSRLNVDAPVLAISSAGFVDPRTGVCRLTRVAGWKDRPLRANLERCLPGRRVLVLNDIEAHLVAGADLYPHPQICLALGTSVGAALTDEAGRIVRTRPGWNLEFGAMRVPTRASQQEVWWLYGSGGLEELQQSLGHDKAARHFGYRVGAFVTALTGVFLPRTVVLSGGIVEACWEGMAETLLEEMRAGLPDWAEEPKVIRSTYGRATALWGMAKYAAGVGTGAGG